MRREQSADAEMDLGAPLIRDQRIGGFLNTIVDELVGAGQAHDELLTDGFPQHGVDLLLRSLEDDRNYPDFGVLPRQASSCNAFCVSAGRRVSLPTISSTTLSV